MKSGIERIAEERQRQIEQEGWTFDHDDEYENYELTSAACCYAQFGYGGPYSHRNSIPPNWPWANKWWKPELDPIRNLEKAGALIAAEIDRLNRLKSKF